MAASALVACTVAFSILPGRTRAADNPAPQEVRLDLRIAGLTSSGAEIEVKPAHAGCRFTPVVDRVTSKGEKLIKLADVRTNSADRECAFSITIREPGQATRTVKRGLRLANPKGPSTPSTLTCFINSPSSLARGEQRKGNATLRR
ncbi:hypothetical protein [Singulisphaera sp. PoT]|uniref:hypothetical protein n=1 Tax=Singulisphaera sp. PoT TaxID=3411797 RepID=UPI003BF59A19